MLTTKLLSLNTEIKQMKLRHIFYTILFSFFSIILQGQTLDDAKAMFNDGNFAEALPVFRAEYDSIPNNAALNQWLGVCLFETGQLMESEKHLVFASKNKINNSYIYLGELYAKMYRFADAEKEFVKFERANRRNKDAMAKLSKKREYVSRLKQNISRTEDIQIIDSIVVAKQDFLDAYNLSNASGKVMFSHNFFRNSPKTDKTVYVNELENKIYYSQMGKLFTMEKLLDTFGNEKLLPENINDKGIQDFPFVMPDGVTIYFASESEESMGGYDIYVTRYNINSDSYLNPNRLNAPFNSPFNDYLMAIDEEKGVGWFASDRFQPSDSVCVYTFIPNTQTTMIENESQEYMINRARISEIAKTLQPDKDYSDILAKAKRRTNSRTIENEIEFVINDKVTYRSHNQFRNQKARNLYSQVMKLEKEMNQLQQQLDSNRERYAAGEKSLRNNILQSEARSKKLFDELEKLKKEVRKEEIKNLSF